jgi:hypothetical protein
MSISSANGRRVFALQVAGLQYRYHSNTPPSSNNLDSTIATGINYDDREGIISVGAFSASVDPSGGIAQYSPLSVTLQIDRRGDLGDPGVVFGRCGARSASTRAQLTNSSNRADTTISVDSDLSSLSYPRLMHIGAETVRANTANSVTVFVTRGQGGTSPQNHEVGLEGSFVPELTTEITTFRGRRAKLYGAQLFPDGSVSDYVEIMNGFIEASPTVEEGDTISLSIVPLTALIDGDLSEKINQTRLLQGFHYFDGLYGSVLEYHLDLHKDPSDRPPRLFTDTTAAITANTFQASVEVSFGYTAILDDFDESLPSGEARDDYHREHPRYPRLKRAQDSSRTRDCVYPTTTAFTASLPGYVINADSTPSDAFSAGEISSTAEFQVKVPRGELKQHVLGDEEVKQFPNVINDILESDGPSSTQGISGGFGHWRLSPDNTIRYSKLSGSPFMSHLNLWMGRYKFSEFDRIVSEENYTPRSYRWSDSGTNMNFEDLSRLWYPIDIGEAGDPYIERINTETPGLLKSIGATFRATNATYQLRDVAKAYYQLYESTILVEGSLNLPSSAVTDETYDVIVAYYDRTSETIKRQTFKATHETNATFGGSTVGKLIHLDNTSDFSSLVSFGDWTGYERALIFRGSSFTEERPGLALLKLLESGGGDQVNGDYDVLGLGLNINSDDIDEESFLSIDTSCPFVLSDQYAGDGTDLRNTFNSILRLMGAVMVMKRDEATGKSKISLQPLGAERSSDSALTVTKGDWLTDPPPHWGIYEDIVTQIKYAFDYDPAEDEYLGEVIFNNQEAINRYGGESAQITLKLPGVDSRQFGRNAGDNFSYFLPSSSRIFNILSNPLRVWRGSIGSGPSIFLDVGAYVTVSSPHLRGYGDSYGVTNGVGMVRSIHQELMGEGCELELLTTGLNPVAWNATATVATIPDTTSVTVNQDDYSGASLDDSSFFTAGDIVDYLPNGDHDNGVTGLEIDSISGNTITFTAAHGISSAGGTLEPTTYGNASTEHKQDAYLADSSDVIDSTEDAQEYS